MPTYPPNPPSHINLQSHRLTHLQKSSLSLSARAPATSAYLGAQTRDLRLSLSVAQAEARAPTSQKKQKQHSTTTTSFEDNKQRGKNPGQTSPDAKANVNANTYVGKRKGGGRVEFCGGCGAPLLVGWSARRRRRVVRDAGLGFGGGEVDGAADGRRAGVVQTNDERESGEVNGKTKSRRPSKRRKTAWDVRKSARSSTAESVAVVDDAGAAIPEKVAAVLLKKGEADQNGGGGAVTENDVRAGTKVETKEDEMQIDDAFIAAASVSRKTPPHVKEEGPAILPASSTIAGPNPAQNVIQLSTTCLRCHRTTRETAPTPTAAPESPPAPPPSSPRPTPTFTPTFSASRTDPPAADNSPNHRLSASAVAPAPVQASQPAARTASRQATQASNVPPDPAPPGTDPAPMAVLPPPLAAATRTPRTTRTTKSKAPATPTPASKTRARAKAREKGNLGG